MRFLRRSLVGIFLLSATLALLAIAGNTLRLAVQERQNQEDRERPQRERVFSVNIVTFEPQTLTPQLIAFGEVQSRRTLDLRSNTAGTVIEVGENVVEGGEVKAGELLLRIDPVEAQAAFDRVQADLLEAEANFRDAERSLAINRDELGAAQDQARLRDRALDRQTDLQTRGVGTTAAVETAELAVSTAKQAILARRQSLASAEANVDQANTNLARVKINVTEAQRALDDTVIHAAFDGTLGGVTIVQGGRVGANEAIGQLIDPSQLEVAFRISTEQYTRLLDNAGRLERGPVDVTLDVGGVDLSVAGQINRESAAVGEGQTGRLLFANLDKVGGFRPGDFVTVRVAEPELERVALLPASALAADNTVLVIGEEERLEVVEVFLLRRQGDDVIVRSRDLRGRQIVAERSPLLGAGIKVLALAPAGAQSMPDTPAMVQLTDERRAALVAFIEGNNRMPVEAKARVLSLLEATEVPAQVVERLESRMGG